MENEIKKIEESVAEINKCINSLIKKYGELDIRPVYVHKTFFINIDRIEKLISRNVAVPIQPQ